MPPAYSIPGKCPRFNDIHDIDIYTTSDIYKIPSGMQCEDQEDCEYAKNNRCPIFLNHVKMQ